MSIGWRGFSSRDDLLKDKYWAIRFSVAIFGWEPAIGGVARENPERTQRESR